MKTAWVIGQIDQAIEEYVLNEQEFLISFLNSISYDWFYSVNGDPIRIP